jgi:hypothetical protein
MMFNMKKRQRNLSDYFSNYFPKKPKNNHDFYATPRRKYATQLKWSLMDWLQRENKEQVSSCSTISTLAKHANVYTEHTYLFECFFGCHKKDSDYVSRVIDVIDALKSACPELSWTLEDVRVGLIGDSTQNNGQAWLIAKHLEALSKHKQCDTSSMRAVAE